MNGHTYETPQMTRLQNLANGVRIGEIAAAVDTSDGNPHDFERRLLGEALYIDGFHEQARRRLAYLGAGLKVVEDPSEIYAEMAELAAYLGIDGESLPNDDLGARFIVTGGEVVEIDPSPSTDEDMPF